MVSLSNLLYSILLYDTYNSLIDNTCLHLDIQDGEAVEFEVVEDGSTGKRKATSVTGPGGAEVMGAPFRPREEEY